MRHAALCRRFCSHVWRRAAWVWRRRWRLSRARRWAGCSGTPACQLRCFQPPCRHCRLRDTIDRILASDRALSLVVAMVRVHGASWLGGGACTRGRTRGVSPLPDGGAGLASAPALLGISPLFMPFMWCAAGALLARLQETAIEDGRYEEAARLRDEFKVGACALQRCRVCVLSSCRHATKQCCQAGQAAAAGAAPIGWPLGAGRLGACFWHHMPHEPPLGSCPPPAPPSPARPAAGAPQGAAAVVKRNFGRLRPRALAARHQRALQQGTLAVPSSHQLPSW